MNEQPAPPGRYTTRDVARALGTSPGGVRNLVYRGRLKRVGGTERHPHYAVEDVAALLAERRARAAA
ncbi:helix-turn-helix domain-containing protein [Streptomyces sp. NBC_01571]|uniref:helix-turn-helix domain-containing protein n=1 Tax=Streptomyces sp. NBC_01571 TaxID=2975883 RepID=UPI002259523C|nr:helix-turn-helix domain-containing protein [Streptomyces sp. NBC_01571]MCX4578129.1 helix-turn-helix domain-containing protein [Streptomyces sp. NBC_01571]